MSDSKRSIPYPEKIIEATLALQNPDGTFGPEDNMCFNWDALFILRLSDQQLGGSHRHQTILDSGNRCADILLSKYRKPDGGFAFFGDTCLDSHHSIRVSDKRYAIGDMLGTRMCVLCLEYADEWNR